MAESCEHLAGLSPADFPQQTTPNGMCGVSDGGNFLGRAARMPILRSRRLLRFFDGQARNQTLP